MNFIFLAKKDIDSGGGNYYIKMFMIGHSNIISISKGIEKYVESQFFVKNRS